MDLSTSSFHRRICTWLVLAAALAFAQSALADSLTVEVDRQEIRLNETLSLTVRYEGRQVNADPDFSGLNQFDILSNHKSTQHSIINGTISAFTEWRMTLAPRNTGQLLIPPLSLQGQHSKSITITVREPSTDPVSGKEDVFLETYVDKSSVYVQEQFVITYRLHFNQSVDSLDTGQFSIDQARVEELPRVDYQTTIGHTPYGVAEFRYAVFPDASGVVNVPEQVWTVRTTDQPGMNRFGFGGGRFKLHRVKTKALAITVNPKPTEFPAHLPWLPAQNLRIEEQWSRSPDEFRVGEPITRTITVNAEGVGPEQLPPLFDERGTPELKYYPDKPEQDKQLTAQGVISRRTESMAIVPNSSGDVTLPEVSVTWWNTTEKRLEKATLPARRLTVAPTEGASAPTAPAPAAQTSIAQPTATTTATNPAPSYSADPRWLWLCAALLLTNLLTLGLWWRSRKSGRTPARTAEAESTGIKNALRHLRQACDRRDPTATRAALLEWTRQRWPGKQVLLHDLGTRIDREDLRQELAKLEAVLFAGAADTVDYALIARAVGQHAEPKRQNQDQPGLAPLYKTTG